MLYVVDGTGEYFDSEYERVMKNSFCRAICYEYPSASYLRGPPLPGGAIKQVLHTIVRMILRDNSSIFLCGYSRGGASVIMISQMLGLIGRKVDGLFLFDPVDSDLTLAGTETIPANVGTVYYARRNPTYADMFETDASNLVTEAAHKGLKTTVDLLRMNILPGVPSVLPINPTSIVQTVKSASAFAQATQQAVDKKVQSIRWQQTIVRKAFFSNCGLKAAPGVRMVGPELFNGTHAALGGILRERGDFPTKGLFDADQDCIRKVKTWMWKNFHSSGLVADMSRGQTA